MIIALHYNYMCSTYEEEKIKENRGKKIMTFDVDA